MIFSLGCSGQVPGDPPAREVDVTCEYPFRHSDRNRDRCGLPVTDGCLCRWHAGVVGNWSDDTRAELQQILASNDHWLEGARLANADLRDLDLSGARLPYADLTNARLSDSCLKEAWLLGTAMVGADLENADLGQAILSEADLRAAVLRSAKLDGSFLSRARLQRAVLDGAWARHGDLKFADLSEASLSGAHLDGAELHGAVFRECMISDVDWGLPGEFLSHHYRLAAAVFQSLSSASASSSDFKRSDHFYYMAMTSLHLDAIDPTLREGERVPHGLRVWGGAFFSRRIWNALGWGFHRWFWGYGVRPVRIILWMFFVILFFGVIVYPNVGINDGRMTVFGDYGRGIALSFVTFATLGYGNFTPAGRVGELLGGVQALLGALLLSAFLVSLATKYVRR